MGPMYISAALKAGGHECHMIIGNSAVDFLPQVRNLKPDLIAFSAMTGLHRWVLETIAFIKKNTDCRTIIGGPHPTFFPDIIYEKGVDIICRGEGEMAMVELADAIDSATDIHRILNLWVKKKDGEAIKNELRPLIQDLDSIPLADRQLYGTYPILNSGPVRPVITSRGCPFDCSFCFNHQMKRLYKGKGPYVRHRSPEAVIREIQALKETSTVKRIYFIDDTFVLNKKWLKAFLSLYGNKIQLPFHCLVRVSLLDQETVSEMKKNSCESVFFGIESGDESLRNDLLGKEISDENIRVGSTLLKKHKIKFRTYNMVGFPGETIAQAFKTVQINIDIKTDFPWCSIFFPYPGTRLGSYAIEKGYLSGDWSYDHAENSFHTTSPLLNPERDKLINLHKFFQTAVLFQIGRAHV